MVILRLLTLSSPASSDLGTESFWSVGVASPLHNGHGFATQMFLSLFSGVLIMILIYLLRREYRDCLDVPPFEKMQLADHLRSAFTAELRRNVKGLTKSNFSFSITVTSFRAFDCLFRPNIPDRLSPRGKVMFNASDFAPEYFPISPIEWFAHYVG